MKGAHPLLFPGIRRLIFISLFFLSVAAFAQTYPVYGPEKKLTINGLTFDAMEPFISADGNTLFFNSINSGGNTNVYYASRVNDTTFNFVGLVAGCYNPAPNHLDAVASIDSLNDFVWVSTRSYPDTFENLHKGLYAAGAVTNIKRIYGDFNIKTLGWLIMDAAINYQGEQLYYCNAYFDFINNTCGGLPCKSRVGVAQKINDSTFNKLANSDGIFSNINDTNYLVYAPQLSNDGTEFYFTRFLRGSTNTEICVSVRKNQTDTFSVPIVIYANPGYVPEAATITNDKQKIYYHQKDNSGLYRIYMRYRATGTGINEKPSSDFKIFYNPVNNTVNIINLGIRSGFKTEIYSMTGSLVGQTFNKSGIAISDLSSGIYFVKVFSNSGSTAAKIFKE